MSFKIIADTFSIARDSKHFTLIKVLKRPNTDDQVWVNLEIVNGEKYSQSIAQSILDTLDDVFFANAELNSYERFESALKEVNLTIKNIKEKRGEKSIGEINAIIAAFSGNDLFLTQSKNAEAYLIRKDKLSMISEGLNGRSADVFVNIASGNLLAEDKIIFTTSRLLRLATHSQLSGLFGDGVAEAIDSIRELVLGDSNLSIGVTCITTKPSRRITGLKNVKNIPYFAVVKKWIDKGLSFLSKKINKQQSGNKVVNKYTKKISPFKDFDKNKILMVIGGFILVLIFSVSFLMDGQRNKELREEYRIRIEAMNQDLHTANTKGYTNDKGTANAILDKVEREARDILETSFFRAEALALLEKSQETRDSINNTSRIDKGTPYIDLSAKNEDIEASGIVNLDENFFVYEYNKLYEIILDQILDPKTIDENEVVIASTTMEDYDQVVFLTQSGRIIEYSDGEIQFTNTEDEAWKSGIDIGAYGRYLYLLSPENNQIYKYPRIRSKYASASEYNIDAELKNAISFAIDGSVYVLNEGGEIIELFKGKKKEFNIVDMASDLSDATKIFTSPEINNLYVLDPINKKVTIIEKYVNGGGYRGQLIFENLDNLEDIYVDKSEDKLYLLTKKAIYRVEI